MTRNEKAVKRFEGIDIPAREENGTVYVFFGDTQLQLDEDEIKLQEELYDEEQKQEG